MKFTSPIAFGLALILTALTPALAQNLPGGSYQGSCVNIRVNGNMLSARCTAPNGQYIHSRLQLPCYGGIANNNGYLRCNGGGGGYRPPTYGGGGGYLPRGSYQASCRNATIGGNGMLMAECTAPNGAYVRSALAVGRCRPGTDIANVNGRLSCISYR